MKKYFTKIKPRIKLEKKRLLFIALIILIILPSCWPLFNPKFFRMHDYTHVARLVELSRALKDGHFPPYWSRNLGWGYGMPLFSFYGSLPYFVGVLFSLFFSFINSIKLVFMLTFFIGFSGMFFLARKFWGKMAGFLAALAFVYSPYRAVDFYVRGALSELFAISLIPWVMWGISEVIDKKNKKIIGLNSLLLAFFLLSHTILDLIILPFFIIFAIFYLLIKKIDKKKLKRVFVSFLLGIGLSSFFLIPAFFEKGFTRVAELTGGYSHYAHHFLYFRQYYWGRWGFAGSVDGPNDGMSFHLGRVHLGLGLITLLLGLVEMGWKRKLSLRLKLIFFFIISGLGLAFLATYKAKSIWDAIPIFSYIQFPWRFNSIIIVLVAFLAGGWLSYLKDLKLKTKFLNKSVLPGALLFLVSALILKVNLQYFKPQEYIDPKDLYYSDEKMIRMSMSGVIPDYIPTWVREEPEVALEDFKVINGHPKVKVLESKTQKLGLMVDSDEESQLQLNRFYFPGWTLYLDGKKWDFEYQDNNGIIKTIIPPGEHEVMLVFKATLIRKMAELISVISGIAILWIILI
ncbi:hypothetical protein COT75_01875 [Candidatus Beckwithbacteria bacterium CG10_big_fil_rev_8_21_14_0_10_34_10]|uniref:Membrane protein 6-pyruvoyl-tetrahydropterin synthase-related domain-containing protein n=1 Tax=Candidatus Beckwithbacteria bacterium CG10_big_fil_rev_8_21_14_0_10_34_10 TaxID=1974495 RepID=A0A2H0W9U6_9BACT|nr:MAG: hypothetical protein COT75_01875 [Candidatus Beckwithbacteria bacterium CG10_big_fil_rev_8_21_14_0_10_34_10]